VLLDARADSLTILARLQVLPPGQSTYAHPAVVGGRIIVRGPRRLECIALTAAESRPADE